MEDLALKLTLSLSGSNFLPHQFVEHFGMNEEIFIELSDYEDVNYIFVSVNTNPFYFSNVEDVLNKLLKFINENTVFFISINIEQVDLFTDVFYCRNQCNFELLAKEFYQLSNHFRVTMPISVYKLSIKSFKELMTF